MAGSAQKRRYIDPEWIAWRTGLVSFTGSLPAPRLLAAALTRPCEQNAKHVPSVVRNGE
jgi:hypothetical protein